MRHLQRLITALCLCAGPVLAADIPDAEAPASPARPVPLSVAGAMPTATVERLLINDATLIGADRIVAVGEHGHALVSDDAGRTWTRGAGIRRTMLTAVHFGDDKTGWAVGHDGLIVATTDAGATWVEQRFEPADEEPLLDVLALDPQRAFAVGAYGLFLETRDGGSTWTRRDFADAGGDEAEADPNALPDDRHLNAITRFGADRLAIVGESGLVKLSADGGQNWQAVTPPYEGSYFGALAVADGALLIHGLRGQAFVSRDDGATWEAASGSGPVTLLGGGVGADGSIALVGPAGTVRLSRDGGKTFVPGAPGEVAAFSTALPLAQGRVLLFGEAGTSEVEVQAQAGDAR